jgi:hypothetical protein
VNRVYSGIEYNSKYLIVLRWHSHESCSTAHPANHQSAPALFEKDSSNFMDFPYVYTLWIFLTSLDRPLPTDIALLPSAFLLHSLDIRRGCSLICNMYLVIIVCVTACDFAILCVCGRPCPYMGIECGTQFANCDCYIHQRDNHVGMIMPP